jgi:hypothetical protein
MRHVTTIASLGLSLLLAAPAFAAKNAKPQGSRAAASSTMTSGKRVAQAADTKPAEGGKAEAPKKGHKKHVKKAPSAAEKTPEAAPAK